MIRPSTKDKVEGKLHEVKGEIKKEVGKAMDNIDLEASGNSEEKSGKIQKWFGRAEKAVGELRWYQALARKREKISPSWRDQ